MYTIYNNEIKIRNVLKGGVVNADQQEPIPKGVSYSIPEEYDSIIFESDAHAKNSILNTSGTNKNLSSKLIPVHFLTKSVPIDFSNLKDEMVQHVINEIIGIEKAMDSIFDDNVDTFNANHANSSGLAGSDKNLEKNILAYGINFAHDIQLVDNEGNILEFTDYLKLLNPMSNSEQKINNYLKYILTGKETAPGGNFDPSFITGYNEVSYETNIVGYSENLKLLIKRLKKLKERHSDVINLCIRGFPRIGVKQLEYMTESLQGGVYDNLNYILNGGAITAVIRTPNISDYFQNQLTYHQRRLKNINKSLTQNSKNSIQQVIDRLREHEKNLKDIFENLKNAVNIDEDKIDVKLHEQKLKSARKQIKKQMTYYNFTQAIMNALEKTETQTQKIF